MPTPDWDERYATDNLPWDTGRPDRQLAELLERGTITPGRALEVGCGTGTNALWLAAHGFEVLGVDISPRAIAMAQTKAEAAGAKIEFRALDFLSAELDEAPFDFVFDRGVLHVFDDPATRARFVEQVARALASGGRWLSLAGSTEGPPRDQGPPRRSARDLVEAVEPELEIVELRSTTFDVEWAPRAWLLLARAREIPAQPSTRRE
ncbi:MAG: class I SAM-dependent methyltransferase [Enhygromyxa sp.]